MGLFKKDKTFASGASYTLLDEDSNELKNTQLDAVKHYIWSGGGNIPLYREDSLSDYIQQISKNGLKNRWDKVLQETNTVGEFDSFRQKWEESQDVHGIKSNNTLRNKKVFAYDMEDACINYVKALEGTEDIHFYTLSFGRLDGMEVFIDSMVQHWGYNRDTGELTKVPYKSPVYFRGLLNDVTLFNLTSVKGSNCYHYYKEFDVKDDSNFIDGNNLTILPHVPRIGSGEEGMVAALFVEEYDESHRKVVKKQIRLAVGTISSSGAPRNILSLKFFNRPQYIHHAPPLPLRNVSVGGETLGRYLVASYKVRGQYKRYTEVFDTLESWQKLIPYTKRITVDNIQYPVIPLRWNDRDMDNPNGDYPLHKKYYSKMISILGYDATEFMDSLRSSVGGDWGKIDGMVLHLACPVLYKDTPKPKSVRKYHELFSKWLIQNTFYRVIHGEPTYRGIFGYYSDNIVTAYNLYSEGSISTLAFQATATQIWDHAHIYPRPYCNIPCQYSNIANEGFPESFIMNSQWFVDRVYLEYSYTGKYGNVHYVKHSADNYTRFYSRETGMWVQSEPHDLSQKYIPIIIPLLKQLSPADQEDLIQRSMRVTMYAKETVKVYRSWVKPFLQIGAFVLAVVITVKSFGTGAKLGASLLKAATSLVVGVAIDKIIDFAVKVGIISPKVASIIKLVVQLTMIAKGAGWDFSKILTAPNIMKTVNLSFDYYNKKKAWEMQEVQKQQNEHNRMHQSRMEALAEKQKMADLGVASDPSLYLDMPSFAPSVNLFETPEMMYARHYNFNVVNVSHGLISNLADGLKYREVDRIQQVRDITQEIEDVLLIT